MTDEHVAAVVVIGDEILRGQIEDLNSTYLAKSLFSIGIKIRRIVVIPDEVDIIAKEVAEASRNYPLVFTSGGVGPTHDDVTYEGVVKGLGLTLKEDKGLLEIINRLFPNKPESRRLAIVPSPCEIIPVKYENETFAIVKVSNVYILPGSPRYFQAGTKAIMPILSPGKTLYNDFLDIQLDELSFVPVLDDLAKRWNSCVIIGSYPQAGNEYRTRITFEGKNKEMVKQAKRDLETTLKPTNRRNKVRFDEEYVRRIYEGHDGTKNVKHAFGILEKCYAEYKPNEVFLSFNGGKDCTVVLHLAAAFAKLHKHDNPLCLYVTNDAFPEVDDFVKEAVEYYGVEMLYKEGPIRQALTEVLKERPTLKACLLGMRRNDPGAHALQPFALTDPGWPELMRVFPIFDWTYNDVWKFLLKYEVSYCSLYDQGYTSLGARNTTTKNPLLCDPNNPCNYLPAHTLVDDSTERHGRS